jgi:hypothetical protein
MKLQAFRESTPALCEKYQSWALEHFRELNRAEFHDLESASRALRSWSRIRRGADAATDETRGWVSPASAETPHPATGIRERLLAMDPATGEREINGVPVRRVPCDGAWFEVGLCEEGNGMTRRWQMLRLADAVSRCKSGHFPRLTPVRSERAWKQHATDLHLEMGWTVALEDTPEQRRLDAIRHACLVDGEDPAWRQVMSRWLWQPQTERPEPEATDLFDEWQKIEPDASAYPILRYTEACAVALHGRVTQRLQRTPKRRLRQAHADQMALW